MEDENDEKDKQLYEILNEIRLETNLKLDEEINNLL